MPSKPCKKAGCARLVRDGSGYCADHQQVKKDRAKKTDSFYSSYQWKQLREYKSKIDPLCEECLKKGKTKKKDMVDHIVAIKDGGSRTDIDNLQSLCWDCHNKKTFGY